MSDQSNHEAGHFEIRDGERVLVRRTRSQEEADREANAAEQADKPDEPDSKPGRTRTKAQHEPQPKE